MVISKLKPGMVVYSVRRNTGMQAWYYKYSTWTVSIIEIDVEKRAVMASWNHNPPVWYYESSWKKWRLKAPARQRT